MTEVVEGRSYRRLGLVLLFLLGILVGGSFILYVSGWRIRIAEIEALLPASYAHEVCGDRAVDSFDPITGEVECARWEPTPAPKPTATPAPTPPTPTETPSPIASAGDILTDPRVFWQAVFEECPVGARCLDLEVGEISKCVGESQCLRAPREKDLQGNITPFYGRNPTACMQDGWMTSVEDRATLGRKEPPEAVGSGVPPGYIGLLEGITLRPCGLMETPTPTTTTAAIPATTETPAPPEAYWPQTSQEFLDWVTEGAPAQLPEGLLPLKLTDISRPTGETNAWEVKPRRQDGNIIPFWVQNPTGCLQDGWRGGDFSGAGIPAGYSGRAEGITFRPCNQ